MTLPRETFASLLLGLLALGLQAVTIRAEEPESWPTWRGPHRDGRSATTGIATDWEAGPPRLVWSSEGAGQGYASLSIVGGTIYTTGNFGDDGQGVVAFDQRNGRRKWATPITQGSPKHGYEGSRCTPTFDDGRLYVTASDGRVVCLDARNGRVIWFREFSDWGGRMMSGWGFTESPLVDGDRVICTPGGDQAMMVALDKRTGQDIWQAKVPDFGDGKNHGGGGYNKGAAYSSIVVSHGAGVKQYVQLVGQGLIGIRAEDGEFLWGYDDVANGTANIPTPIVDGDLVFGSTGYGTGSCLLRLVPDGNGVKAEEVYFLDARTLENHHGGMIQVGRYLYGGHKHNEGFPICVELETGEVVWGGDERGPGGGSAAVAYVDGHLVFRYQNGVIALIEATPDEYRLKGSFTPEYQERESWSHPVIVDGRMYLREQDKLMCYDLTAGR